MTHAPFGFVGPNVNANDILVVDPGSNGADEIWAFSPDTAEGERRVVLDPGNVDWFDITHSALGEVFVCDTLNGAVLQRMSPQGTLTPLPLNPPLGAIDGVVHDDVRQRIYVTDRSDGTVHAVDPTTGSTTLVADGFTALGLAGLEIDSVGRRLWVTDAGDNRVYEFELPPATDSATYVTFGQGCPGSIGVPILSPALGQLPWTGSPFTVELTNLPATFLAIMATGFSNTTWGGFPLPVSLTAVGMPNCDLYINPELLFAVSIVDGRASWTLSMPATISLAGLHFYNQGAVLDPGVNAIGLVMSNAGDGTIGVR